jgi:hypothetical protein
MPRHNHRRPGAQPEASDGARLTLGERVEQWRGIDYVVRTLAGTQAGRAYRCPGCDQELRPGQPHVVAWPADDLEADDRRHWHTVCWSARDRRAPTVQRGRGTPRY